MGCQKKGLMFSVTKSTMLALALVGACALGLAACAPQAKDAEAQDEQSAKGETPAIEVDFAWSESADCGMCHAKEQGSLADAACNAAGHAGVACGTCHADAAALTKAHEGATSDKAAKAALKATAVSPETCESCHARDEVAAATAESTVLVDTKGTQVNPHALPESDDHAGIACNNCHQMHVSGADVQKKAARACASCHHADVYECYTCHS